MEVRKFSDPLTEQDWATFEQIVKELPEPKLRKATDIVPQLPQWQEARTLPVNDLALEEQQSLAEYIDPAAMAERLKRLPGLLRLLKQRQVTPEQFAGLVVAIGAACRRSHLAEDYPFDDAIRHDERTLARISKDHRLFAGISPEDRYRVLDDAVALHRVHRAQQLKQVPADNVKLVQEHQDFLKQVLPEGLLQHPFEDVMNLLEERGLPFIESRALGSDDDLRWKPEDAVVGRD